jgi:hypothetical protein
VCANAVLDFGISPLRQQEGATMDTNQEKQPIFISRKTPPESDPTKINLNAPAGAPNSLGAESVRDGRPSTDDSVVEAIDEETPPLAGN